MANDSRFEPASELTPGRVVGVDRWALGNAAGERFAVSRRCRHLGADLAGGSIAKDGCLVCPSHGSRYDTSTGHMVRGPQGIYAKIPGLGVAFKLLTRIIPLRVGKVTQKDDSLTIET